jgi:hypothetical protein
MINDITLRQIAVAKAMVNKGDHSVWCNCNEVVQSPPYITIAL